MRTFKAVVLTLLMIAAGAVAADAAGDACSIQGKYIGTASLAVTGSALKTSHFDITFTAVDCDHGIYTAVTRLQELGTTASIDEELNGVYSMGDGFLFIPLPGGIIVLGEPALCANDTCYQIPITAAREGNPDVRFAGSMTRASGAGLVGPQGPPGLTGQAGPQGPPGVTVVVVCDGVLPEPPQCAVEPE